ncbi:MAG: phosphotriesterase-related protein, partial [Chloroflexi bacterium]|nr:phosphotriesterase-related protein [Chloroflexota bacterium]
MAKSERTGKVQTVLGLIDPGELGITHTHEHLLIDMMCYFQMPEEASERAWVDAKVTMDRLAGGTGRFTYFKDAIQLLDVDAAIAEILKYKYAGGNSLVDTTNIGLGRDPLALARISRATGLNVIMGSSYYVPISHPNDMDSVSEQSITDRIVRDVTVGAGDTGVRSGVIGEIGNFWPTHPHT